MNKGATRFLSLLLVLIMCMALLPAAAFAEEAAPAEEIIAAEEPLAEEEEYLPEAPAAEPETPMDEEIADDTAAEPVEASDEPEITVASGKYINDAYRDILSEDYLPECVPDAEFEAIIAGDAKYQGNVYTTVAGAGKYMRGRFNAHTTSFTFSIRQSKDFDACTMGEKVYNSACKHTGVSTEGDYMYFSSVGGYSFRYTYTYWDGEKYRADYEFTPCYYTTKAQETKTTAAAEKILSSLNLKGKTDYQKIEAIYNWLVKNVSYDYEHLYDSSYTTQYTAYGALVKKTCVCQGIAAAFYRLCLEAGVDNREISSDAMCHAYSIVALDGKYYYCDATWDINMREDGYTSKYYFLKGKTEFYERHERGDQFDKKSFREDYPVPTANYKKNYTIKFNGNGATSGSTAAMKDKLIGKSYTLTSNGFKRTGYVFVGWNTKKDGSGKSYKNGATIKDLTTIPEKTVTLYAQWRKK